MALLTFDEKYTVSSDAYLQLWANAGDPPGIDTEATQNFNLAGDRTVFAFWVGSADQDDFTEAYGFTACLYIDGSQECVTGHTTTTDYYPAHNFCFWVGTLAAGAHTISGGFRTNQTAGWQGIRNHRLVIMIFNGNEFAWLSNTADVISQTGLVMIDDNFATVNITPSGACKALILSQNVYDWDADIFLQSNHGRQSQIDVNGTPYSLMSQTCKDFGVMCCNVTLHAMAMPAALHTIKTQFACNKDGDTTTIQYRYVAVLLFDDTTEMDYGDSDVQVTTATLFPTDDAQSTINRNIEAELLAIAVGCGNYATAQPARGICYGLEIDGTDRSLARRSPYSAALGGVISALGWAETMAAGAHVVQGRFGRNTALGTAIVDTRRVAAYWFPTGGPAPPAGGGMASKLIADRLI